MNVVGSGSSVSISDCELTNNSADAYYSGGAIYVSGSVSISDNIKFILIFNTLTYFLSESITWREALA